MIIYNLTIKVADAIQTEWLTWLKEEHVPDVLATKCFSKATILHLLETDDSDGSTYAIQYSAESMDDYKRYIDEFAPVMRQRSFDCWGDQFIAFRSILEVVN
jgi:hypothetical protein